MYMQEQIETVEMLKKTGKLERKLVYRIVVLFFDNFNYFPYSYV